MENQLPNEKETVEERGAKTTSMRFGDRVNQFHERYKGAFAVLGVFFGFILILIKFHPQH